MIFPFGKHRGKRVRDIPLDYLQWVQDNCDIRSEDLADEIRETLEGDTPTPAPAQVRKLGGQLVDRDVFMETFTIHMKVYWEGTSKVKAEVARICYRLVRDLLFVGHPTDVAPEVDVE